MHNDCERLAEGLVAQPVNAWSSLAFIGAGLWLARRASGVTPERRTLALLYAAAVAANGVGSWFFHGPGTDAGRLAHDGAILAALLAVGATLPAAAGEWRGVAAGRRTAPWAGSIATLALLGSGLVVYARSRSGEPWCRPDALVQGHAFWHLATAGVLLAWGGWVFPLTAARSPRSDPSLRRGTRRPTRSPTGP